MVHFNPDRWRCKNWYFLTYTHTYWLYPCPSCLLHDLEYVTPVDGAIFLSKGIWKSGFECKTVSLELMTSDASEAKMKFWPMKYISRRFIKHEYLRSRAYICLSLSSPSGDLSIKSWTIEILVLTSWIPASKNFRLWNISTWCKMLYAFWLSWSDRSISESHIYVD